MDETNPALVDTCIFCKIVAGQIPAQVLHRDDRALAFLDLAPKEAGHTLVIPTRHVADLTSDADVLTEIAPAVTAVAAQLVDRLGATGINAVVNSGASAGQEVFHLHVHLIPRGVTGIDKDDRDGVVAKVAGG